MYITVLSVELHFFHENFITFLFYQVLILIEFSSYEFNIIKCKKTSVGWGHKRPSYVNLWRDSNSISNDLCVSLLMGKK